MYIRGCGCGSSTRQSSIRMQQMRERERGREKINSARAIFRAVGISRRRRVCPQRFLSFRDTSEVTSLRCTLCVEACFYEFDNDTFRWGVQNLRLYERFVLVRYYMSVIGMIMIQKYIFLPRVFLMTCDRRPNDRRRTLDCAVSHHLCRQPFTYNHHETISCFSVLITTKQWNELEFLR